MFLWETKSRFSNKNKRKRYSKITDECKQFILNYVNEHKQFKIKILSKCIRRKFKFSVSNQSIYNTLKDNKITNKRIKENHYNHSENKLNEHKKAVDEKLKNENYDVVSIDETSIYINCRNNYGWSKKGKECEIKCKPAITKYSVVFTITKDKVVGFTIKSGAFNGKYFNKFMMQHVVSKNNKNKKYFLDNAKIHHSRILNKQIKNNCIFNIPYCSKFNPIEMYFNTLKRYLSQNYICSMSSLRRQINFFISRKVCNFRA